MTKLKLTLLAAVATLSLTNPASSFAADARITHICSRKLRLVLRVLFLVWAAGSVLGSTETRAQNAYITNFGSNTVSVIDTLTNTVTATSAVDTYLAGVAVSPDGSKVYVASEASNTVSVIDARTNKVTATIAVTIDPLGVAVTPDGTKVYVGGNDVSVIDARTNKVTATIPVDLARGVAVSSDGSKVYVAIYGNNTLDVLDTRTDTVIDTIGVGFEPFGVAVSPDDSKVYVSNYGGFGNASTVSVIKTANDTLAATIPVGTTPFGLAVTPDGSKVYVANYSNGQICSRFPCNTVSVIDTAKDTVITNIPVDNSPFGVAVTPDGRKVYVANQGASTISVIATATDTVAATIPLGNGDGPAAFGIFIRPAKPSPKFAGTPGKANCHGKSVSALAKQYGGLNAAAAALDFPSVRALQQAIMEFCEG